jgi:hypothetical protein
MRSLLNTSRCHEAVVLLAEAEVALKVVVVIFTRHLSNI